MGKNIDILEIKNKAFRTLTKNTKILGVKNRYVITRI